MKGHIAGMSEISAALAPSILPSDADGKHADSRLRHGETLGYGALLLVKRAARARRAPLLSLAASTATSRVLRGTAILTPLPRALAHRTPANRQSDTQAEHEN